ncbi:MAG: pitrilysin family protein [Myxococcaceae bacterium]
MKRALLALLALATTPVWAQSDKIEVPYERYELPNGLEVILHEDKRLPVVTVNIWYHVGAFDEPQGRSGFAHLFEHMMFQGSKHIADDRHIAMLEQIGATDLNGTTNFDRTNYFETVPSNHLETALWLESDRMGFLLDALTPEKLKNQQEVVKNERRQRYETAPYGLAEEKLWHALFPQPHPYYGNVIGSMADLDAATLDDVKDFFRTWYAPSNATLVIAGDFDKEKAKALVEKYFGSLPSRPKPKAPTVQDAQLDKEVVIRHDEEVASLPSVFVAWHTPALFKNGDAAADVLASILSHGKASRLHRRLVREKQIAQSVSAYQQSIGAQSVFTIEAVAAPGHTTEELLKEIDAVLAEVREKGVTADEVTRSRNRIETGFVSGLQSVAGLADRLQAYNHYLGKPDWFAQDLARYEAVTPEEVQSFAREYLKPDRRVVVHAVPRTPEAH